MKRPGNLWLLTGLGGLLLTGALSLALIWDRLPTDLSVWPGAADRVGARARQQAQAAQAAEAWSRSLTDGLVCAGDLATTWAAQKAPPGLDAVARELSAAADACRTRLPQLQQVWLLPGPERSAAARALFGGADAPALGKPSERTLARLREAAESEVETYAVAPGEPPGVDQIVPVRGNGGDLLVLRYRAGAQVAGSAASAADEPMARLLDAWDPAQGVPVRRASGLRVAIASDPSERLGLSLLAMGLLLAGAGAVAWHSRDQRRHQMALEDQARIAEEARMRAQASEADAQQQRRKAEDWSVKLEEEIGLRQTIEDAVPIGLRVIDGQGRITAVNKAFCRDAGWTPQQLVNCQPPYPFWPVEDIENRAIQLQEVLGDRVDSEGFRVQFSRPNGEKWLAEVHVSRLQRGEGWILSSLDITAETERQRRVERLEEQLMRQVNFYILGEQALQLAHDLLSHVSAVEQSTANLISAASVTAAAQISEDLLNLESQAAMMKAQLDGFASQVKGELKYEYFNIHEVIEAAILLESDRAKAMNARVINATGKEMPLQLLPRVPLMQVLRNLISNGLKSMVDARPENRRVVINSFIESDPATPSTPTGRNWLHLTVDDRGRGMTSDQLDKLFDEPKASSTGGFGLGLWMCRRWVERMGGKLSVQETKSPRGTVMLVVLPYQLEKPID